MYRIVAGLLLFLLLVVLVSRVLALNDTVKLWTFNTANIGQYTYNSSLVSLDDSGARPNANKFSNAHFDSGNSNWNVGAAAVAGWVEVPGNPGTYGTNNFLVMKYEAKAYDTQTSQIIADGGNSLAANWAGGNTQTRYVAMSVPEGRPWVRIAQSSTSFDSFEACSAIGPNYHLISNNEWQTIARNAEAQNQNWTLGSVGNGYLFAGHNDNQPAQSLRASSNDANVAAFTNSTGDTEALTVASNLNANQSGTAGNQVRVLTLSNGSKIWDLSGNVWEWTSNTITEADQPDQSGQSGYAYREFPNITNWGPLGADAYRPANTSFNTVQGVGRIYSNSESASTAIRAFLRGGGWSNTSNAGAFALYLDFGPTNSIVAIGFRCASDPVEIFQSYLSSAGREDGGGNEVAVGNIADARLYQTINVGDTNQYNLSAVVKDNTEGSEGGVVDSNVAALYHNGAAIATNYTDLGEGWYKLSATITGSNSNVDYGLAVKTGKTVIADNFILEKANQIYSLYTSEAYLNNQVSNWDTFCEGTLAASTCNTDVVKPLGSEIRYQLCDDDAATCESGNSWKYYDGDSWEVAADESESNTVEELSVSVMNDFPTSTKKIAVKAFFIPSEFGIPVLNHLTVGMTTDLTAPGNISEISMKRTSAVSNYMELNDWTNQMAPYFEWDEAFDNPGGVGIMGYCLYISLGETNPNLQTAISPYLPGNTNLDEVHITSADTECGNGSGFLVSTLNIDFADADYRGTTWLETSNTAYYLYIAAVDNAGNITDEPLVSFNFRFDNGLPTNVAYLSCAAAIFASVADMNFSWPIEGAVSSSDSSPGAGLLGWQYQINSIAGPWLGTAEDTALGIGSYIPLNESSRTLTQDQDGEAIDIGDNIVYFRTVDAAGNVSSEATIRTCKLAFGGAAPTFGGADSVTVTPSISESNSFALSWPEATPSFDRTIQKYYYMVNAAPPSILSTLQTNPVTYIDNGNNLTVSATSLPNVNKGTNTVYVVAIDDNNNYSPSNYITGTFTLDSNDPDNVGSLTASDSSIKAESRWMVTLTWLLPVYQGAGNLTYIVLRSENGTDFTEVGTSTGLSYVDLTPESKIYYYKVITKDGANSLSSGTNAVSILPTGRFVEPAPLESEPVAINITAKKAEIQWSTSRPSDSKIANGTESGNYHPEETANSEQKTFHSINLQGLNPDTTYYYRAKWTDGDGNTGISEEKTFTTAPPPFIKDVVVSSVNLSSAVIKFTSVGASKVKVYYGTTTAFGGVVETGTSIAETIYFTQLTGLSDGTKYFYRINVLDEENAEYSGTILDFTTPPRPNISNLRLQQVQDTAESTVLVTFETNTATSSIVSYYPQSDPSDVKEVVRTEYVGGEQSMQVGGLLPNTNYMLTVKARDSFGNEVSSNLQRFTTATDTRPPKISDLRVETTIVQGANTSTDTSAQIIISWTTDEPATSQVEFGEGTGTAYTQKTQEDLNLVLNHTVIISNLSPAKVYHVRAISKDEANNSAFSVDMATITPKASDNILEIIIRSLLQLFQFGT